MFHGFGGGIGLLGIVVVIVFWAVVALLVITLVQNYRHGPRHLHSHGWHRGGATDMGAGTGAGMGMGRDGGHGASDVAPAIAILRERFARGEISEEEFTRRLTLLKES
jgi:uncharacterized membrane protein